MHIEDYGLIGNCRTAALISREGSMDWLCLPRFDSPACFAALIGNSENGRWLIQPAMPFRSSWKYRKHSLILETEFITNTGRVILTDLMPIRVRQPCIIRRVRGMEGRVSMHMEYVLRFDYGSLIPWVRKIVGGGIDAMVGPDHVRLRTQVPLQHQGFTHRSEFSVNAGEEIYFTMIWTPSHEEDIPDIAYPSREIEDTHLFWKNWASKCTYHGPWKEEVLRSLITLKALTYQPTGGIIAAPTTSLPEMIGGSRNWDYRYCWLRDATFTLYALLSSGYREEAEKWREWLIRAVAGIPSQMNIVHGIAGEHRLPEIELPWLSGYENSRPVRMGNLAYQQYQLDVYGEVMDTLHLGRKNNLNASPESWDLQKKLLEYLEGIWKEPDSGVWESRGPEKHFVYSKVMAWVAMDRGIKAVEMFKRDGSVDRWRKIRDEIHQEVCQKGFDTNRQTFVQAYGQRNLDSSLLLLPLVGFLPAQDLRIVNTVKAIEHELMHNGFLIRYQTEKHDDGLTESEGAFLACTFWLADCLVLQGHVTEAKQYFERLLSIQSDLGLFAEEYDSLNKRQLGNFPQALSHIALINTARNLSPVRGPAEDRSNETADFSKPNFPHPRRKAA